MVTPDVEVTTAAGQRIAVVSQDGLVKALAAAAIVLDQVGGCLFVQVERVSTGVPGEMRTALAQTVWKDRTDAKPQPEQTGTLTTPVPAAAPVVVGAREEDYAPQPGDVAVDESGVPAGLREGA